MISCRLKGGIGNLMFQIAATEYMSKSSGFPCGYWNANVVFNGLNNGHISDDMKHATDYLKIFKNFHWPKCEKPRKEVNVPFEYVKVNVNDNVEYNGYFQSEQYFPDRQLILNLFQPSDLVNDKLSKYSNVLEGNTCSIHVRRGDYLRMTLQQTRDMDYYNKCMNVIGEVDKYLIFSDDLEWCKQNFIGDKFVFIENEKDYVELFLQSKCNHNIIASSSFSWWGAYLNNNVNKKVVGPKQWFSTAKINNIIPTTWTTV